MACEQAGRIDYNELLQAYSNAEGQISHDCTIIHELFEGSRRHEGRASDEQPAAGNLAAAILAWNGEIQSAESRLQAHEDFYDQEARRVRAWRESAQSWANEEREALDEHRSAAARQANDDPTTAWLWDELDQNEQEVSRWEADAESAMTEVTTEVTETSGFCWEAEAEQNIIDDRQRELQQSGAGTLPVSGPGPHQGKTLVGAHVTRSAADRAATAG